MHIPVVVLVISLVGVVFMAAGMNPKSVWGFVGIACLVVAIGTGVYIQGGPRQVLAQAEQEARR